MISPLTHDFTPVLVQHPAATIAASFFCGGSSFWVLLLLLLPSLNQGAQVFAGEIERHLLAKEGFQAILAFGGVAEAMMAAASTHCGVERVVVVHDGAHCRRKIDMRRC